MVGMMTFFHMPKLDQPIITVRPVLGHDVWHADCLDPHLVLMS